MKDLDVSCFFYEGNVSNERRVRQSHVREMLENPPSANDYLWWTKTKQGGNVWLHYYRSGILEKEESEEQSLERKAFVKIARDTLTAALAADVNLGEMV